MSKGTPSFGKKNKINHGSCRRCGRHTYHLQHHRCSACGFPDAKIRNFRWMNKNPLTKERKHRIDRTG